MEEQNVNTLDEVQEIMTSPSPPPTPHIVRDDVYIPIPDDQFPDNPKTRMLSPEKIYSVEVDEHYPFLMSSFKEKALHFLVYAGIFTFVFPLHVLRYGLKIKGRKNLKKNREILKNGALTVANHVYRWDFLAVIHAVRYRRLWFPTFADNIESKDRILVRSAGGIPIPEKGIAAMRKFFQAFDALHQKGKWIHIFPESFRWEFYQPIRPFKIGAFEMAYRYAIPVIPIAIQYRPVKGWRKIFGIKHPLITVSIGEPIEPDKTRPRKEESERLAREAHARMCRMAGIVQNRWDAVTKS